MGNLVIKRNALKALSLFLFLALMGCGSKLPKEIVAPLQPESKAKEQLTGNFVTTDGLVIDLGQQDSRYRVVVFSQDTCGVCSEEAHELKHALDEFSQLPSNVVFYTILTGAYPEDATYWKQDHQAQWTVGYEENSELFLRFCPERKVPCTLVAEAGNANIFHKTIGKISIDKLKELTQGWSR